MDHFAERFGLPRGAAWNAEELLDQERRLVLPALDEAVCLALGGAMLARAEEASLPVAIEVHLRGRLVFRAMRPGTNAANEPYLAGKRRWVEQSGHASLLGSLAYRREHPQFQGGHGDRVAETGPFGGGVPLRSQDGELAGIALVSGLSEEDDHALVVWAIEGLLGQ